MKKLKPISTLSNIMSRIFILFFALNLFTNAICNEKIESKKAFDYEKESFFDKKEIQKIEKNSSLLNMMLSKLSYFYENRNEKQKLVSSKHFKKLIFI